MWGRFVGKKSIGIALLRWAILFVFFQVSVQAQELPEWLKLAIEEYAQNGSADGGDSEQLYDYYISLLGKKVDINGCSREELEDLLFLDTFMVESILAYREEYGAIYSVAELSLVDGFNEELAGRLAPFFRFGMNVSREDNFTVMDGRWDTRLRYKLLRDSPDYMKGAIPFSALTKFRLDAGEKSSIWFTLESDAGEVEFPDFVSLGMCVDNIPVIGNFVNIRRFVVGDYSLRMGQGLLLWNSFSLTVGSEPSSALRRSSVSLMPYRSSSESGFYRGGAVVLEFGKLVDGTLFYSSNLVDANVKGDYFYSLPSDGLHDSEHSILSKRSLKVEHTGFELSASIDNFKIGARGVWYRYDKEDARKVYEYNKFSKFKGWWYACSADFLLNLDGLRCFGEFVIDRKGGVGAVAGILGRIGQGWESSLLLKYYDKRLLVPVGLNNECGGTLSIKWSGLKEITFSGAFSYVFSPHSRYRVEGSSSCYKGELSTEWRPSSVNTISFRMRGSNDTGTEDFSLNARCIYVYSPNELLSLSGRVDMSFCGSFGFLGYLDVRYGFAKGALELSMRGTFFDVPSWSGRIYCYESDIPGTFSTIAYYGRGVSGYFLLKYKPKKWVSVNLRCGGVLYNDPSKDIMRFSLGVSLPF